MTAKIKKGGTRGTLFKEVAKMRLEDAAVLLSGKRYHGAIYLSGYAVECALKWAITVNLGSPYLPKGFETHDLEAFVHAAGLLPSLQRDRSIRSLYSVIVDEWQPSRRYSAAKISPRQATTLYTQALQLYEWIIETKS
jgi:HEPN domain-containing protein